MNFKMDDVKICLMSRTACKLGVPLHGKSHIIKTTLSCVWLPIATLSTLLSKAHAVCHRLVRILQAGVGDGHAR